MIYYLILLRNVKVDTLYYKPVGNKECSCIQNIMVLRMKTMQKSWRNWYNQVFEMVVMIISSYEKHVVG